ncbi:MAG TPA: vWA domain-containing protein, partial [Gemmataceae bacterium]|nr:vWA domain-containing protein [Gemmataceae bacterium]
MTGADHSLTFVTDPLWPWSLPYGGLTALALVALVLVALTVWTYLGVPQATGRRVALLVLLRLTALALALAVLLRPAVAFRDELHVPSTLAIAADYSGSMSMQDEFDGQSRWAAVLRTLRDCQPILQKLRDEQNVNVVLYRFAGDVGDFDPNGKADGKRTDFGELLHTLYERHRSERHLRGLVILSDGADNGTRYQPMPLAAQWRSLPCPVSTVAFGKPTTGDKQNDIALTAIKVEPSPVALKGQMTVKATADAPGFESAKVRVHLLFDDKEVATQDDTLLLTTGNEIKVKCNAPDKPGEIKVTVRVDALPGEVSVANNEI